jgi:hypothetical protein
VISESNLFSPDSPFPHQQMPINAIHFQSSDLRISSHQFEMIPQKDYFHRQVL